jgi:phytol kinase
MTLLFALTIVLVFILLVASEVWWRSHHLHDEFSRKFIHITVGSFVAFWPFFLTWDQIRVLSLAFLIAIVVSKRFHVFKAIHSVQRPTWGEIYFALAVGAIAFVTQSKWVYMAALLQMSLADGLAAVVGTKFGKRQRYLVYGHAKSVIGTLTFFVVSCLILIVYFMHAQALFGSMLWLKIVIIGVVSSILENISVQGLDNLLVPLVTALLLTLRT